VGVRKGLEEQRIRLRLAPLSVLKSLKKKNREKTRGNVIITIFAIVYLLPLSLHEM